MPLSEREQQILDDLERDLKGDRSASAPKSSRPRERFAGLKIGILLVLVGVVMLVWFFASRSIVVGVASFAMMVVGIVLGASSVRAEMGDRRDLGRRVTGIVTGWERSLRQRDRDDD